MAFRRLETEVAGLSTQARLLAKQLRQAAAVIDPDPNTEA